MISAKLAAIDMAIKRLTQKHEKQGAMVPPPIRQVLRDRINKLHNERAALVSKQ